MNKGNKPGANSRSNSNLGFRQLNSNITLERNGSEPNLFATSLKNDKTTQLRIAYNKYLCSLAAKYSYQQNEKKIILNINEQRAIFREEFDNLKQQLVSLSEELKLINKLKIEKKTLAAQFEELELFNKSLIFDDTDKEIMLVFTQMAFKVVVKNFKKMDENDLSAVKNLLNDIIEPIKCLNYDNKIHVRNQLKDVLIKLVTLIKELDTCKIKCEELFDKQESMQKYNTSLKIMKDQYGENPSSTLPPIESNLMEEVQHIFE